MFTEGLVGFPVLFLAVVGAITSLFAPRAKLCAAGWALAALVAGAFDRLLHCVNRGEGISLVDKSLNSEKG